MPRKIIVASFLVVFAAALGISAYSFLSREGSGRVACTKEAKICPDGTAVGRIGPNCEFAPCPGEKNGSATMGVVQGKVSVGPICPVEREGAPCEIPPEVYTSRTLVILSEGGKREVSSAPLHPDGTYKFVLAPGSYVLDMKRQGIDSAFELPHAFKLSRGEMFEFNLSIDTGIR